MNFSQLVNTIKSADLHYLRNAIPVLLKPHTTLNQSALRKLADADTINANLHKLLSNPRVTKTDERVLIEVSDPFLMDNLRQWARQLGFIYRQNFDCGTKCYNKRSNPERRAEKHFNLIRMT